MITFRTLKKQLLKPEESGTYLAIELIVINLQQLICRCIAIRAKLWHELKPDRVLINVLVNCMLPKSTWKIISVKPLY
jgi:hypothetical protein